LYLCALSWCAMMCSALSALCLRAASDTMC
jgi:hypothetical protein